MYNMAMRLAAKFRQSELRFTSNGSTLRTHGHVHRYEPYVQDTDKAIDK